MNRALKSLSAFGVSMLLSTVVSAQSLTAAEVFFDEPAPFEGEGVSLTLPVSGALQSVSGQLDTTSLDSEVHVVFMRSRDDASPPQWSPPIGQVFIKPGQENQLIAAEYFFNNTDAGPGNNSAIELPTDDLADILHSVTTSFAIASLPFGLNRINLRTRDSAGVWGAVISQLFVNHPSTISNNALAAAEFFIGVDPGLGNATSIVGSFNDVIGLFERGDLDDHSIPGRYKLGYRSKDSAGNWSPTVIHFYEVPVTGLPDPPGVTVSSLDGNTSESGASANFSVVLDVQPAANVVFSISSSDTSEAVVSTTQLLFTPENWNAPQTVVVTGVDDTQPDGDTAFRIGVSAASSDDLRFHGRYGRDLFAVNIDVDLDPPFVTASVESNAYEFSQSVRLICVDLESGCANVFYTLDNSQPTANSTPYTGPIAVDRTLILKAIAIDVVGRISPTLIKSYEIAQVDDTPPALTIVTPIDGGNYEELFELEGTAADGQSGVKQVQVQITDGNQFWGPLFGGFGWIDTPFWLDAFPGNHPTLPQDWSTWGINASSIGLIEGTTYTITAKAIDHSGNETVRSALFSVAGDQAFTTLSADVSAQTFLQNEMLDIAGKLTRLPETTISLGGRDIRLIVTKPDGTQVEQVTQTYDTLGHYIFENIDLFNLKGNYLLELRFAPTPLLAASSVSTSVLVGSSAGYAIVLQGKHPSSEGLASHNKTTRRIYDTLIQRGFSAENITFLNYDDSQAGVDGVPSRAALEDALTLWLPTRVNNSPAPIYLIFADHGDPDTFYLDGETFSSADLNNWLSTMEGSLSPAALREPRTVIYGACYSGSFLPALSQGAAPGNAGRVIITSSAADEVSYKGPNEPDNIRSGEYFLEALFKELGRGSTLAKAFRLATNATETYTRRGNGGVDTANAFFDNAVQHPLLDDNGDRAGTNLISEGSLDGRLAAQLRLGAGLDLEINSLFSPAEVTSVAPLQILAPGASGAPLWLTANDDSDVSTAWAEVRSPQVELNPTASTEQLSNNLPKLFMVFDPRQRRWEATYPNFIQPGRYEIFYFVKDRESGDISAAKIGPVYKQKSINQPPTAVELIAPLDNAFTATELVLDWSPSSDPDNHPIRYSVEIATDPEFINIAHRQDDLASSFAIVDASAGLLDLTQYYWRVRSVDFYGASALSATFIFNTDNTNNTGTSILTGLVFSATSQNLLTLASIELTIESSGTTIATTTDENGEYFVATSSGDSDVTIASSGFSLVEVESVELEPGTTTELNLLLVEDQDGDRMPDTFEESNGLDPLNAADAYQDSDGDGVSNYQEFLAGTNPQLASSMIAGSNLLFGELAVGAASVVEAHNLAFSDPVVIAGIPSVNHPEFGVARLGNNSHDSFALRFQEWDYQSDVSAHGIEVIPYLVAERGRHTLTDGTVIEVGTFELGGTGVYQPVVFDQAFTHVPYLLLSVQTSRGPEAVSVKALDVTSSGFSAALYEQQSWMDGHVIETVGYLAISHPQGAPSAGIVRLGHLLGLGDKPYGLTRTTLTHKPGAALGFGIRLEEEQSADSEFSHASEQVDLLKVGGLIFGQIVSSESEDPVALRRSDTCIQLVTHAWNPETGAELDFNTPCDIPLSWVQGMPPDSDGDGMNDAFEIRAGLNPAANDADGDLDGDGLSNLDEHLYGSDPTLVDSDGDGASDREEVEAESDPADAGSLPYWMMPSGAWRYILLPTPVVP